MKVDCGLAVRVDNRSNVAGSRATYTARFHFICQESLGTTNLFISKATMDGETLKMTKIGQLKRHEGLKVVYLMESAFQIWNDRKKELSWEGHMTTSNKLAISK